MKAYRIFTIIILAVMLLAVGGCQFNEQKPQSSVSTEQVGDSGRTDEQEPQSSASSENVGDSGLTNEQKLEKLQQQTEKLLTDGKFEEAVEGCDKALADGLGTEEVYPLIERIYTDWAMNTLTQNGTNITPSLQVIDRMIEKYPDLKESGENIILDLGKWAMESYGEDVEGMRKVFEAFIDIYWESDVICEGLDARFLELVKGFMDEKTDELVNNGLLNDLDADRYEDVFDEIDDFRLFSYKIAINYPRLFPYVKDLGNGKVLQVEYVTSFFTVYYGELDSQGRKTGEAVQLTYAVNMKEQDKYQKEYLRGQFENDMVNGAFREYMYKCVSVTEAAVNSGVMVENKYDGEIRSHHERDGETAEYVFNFEEGMIVKIGHMINYPGYYAVGIDDTTNPDDEPRYFGYKEEDLETERGFYPYYRTIY